MMINYRAAHMESVAATASHMVKQMLERQPLSPAKVTFAYRVAAGPALAKAASVDVLVFARVVDTLKSPI